MIILDGMIQEDFKPCINGLQPGVIINGIKPDDGFSNPVIRAPLTIAAGESASVIFCADKSVSPGNYLQAKIDRATGLCTLTRYLTGSPTSLISVAVTYADAKELVIVVDKAANGLSSDVSIFYGGVQVGTTQTITSAAILNGRRHYISDSSSPFYIRRFSLGSELLINGSFEAETTGWDENNCTISPETTIVYSGDKSLKVVDAGSGSKAYQSIITTIGKIYSVSGAVYSESANTGSFLARLAAANTGSAGSSTWLTQYKDDSDGIAKDDAWHLQQNTLFVATAETTYALLVTQSDTGDTSYFDNASLKKVVLP